MLIGSLCTGYGGLDHAVMNVFGGKLGFVADIDPGSCKLLEYRYPSVPNLGDISKTDWSETECTDILTAGFPCQPISQAGKKLGEADERWLWPEVERAIRGLRPRLVILENVSAILVRGLGAVLGSLAALGYVGSYRCVRASEVGAPHQRDRWFCLAYPADAECPRLEGQPERRLRGLEPAQGDQGDYDWGLYQAAISRWEGVIGRSAPRPVVPGGRPDELNPVFVEWMMGLPAGWVTEVPSLSYREQLHLLGNGVVPDQAEYAVRLAQSWQNFRCREYWHPSPRWGTWADNTRQEEK